MTEYWLAESLNRALRSLAEKQLAVDVGANNGSWTSLLSCSFERVIAVEPDQRAYGQIPKLYNVSLVPVAVSSRSGESEFFVRPSPDQNSLLRDHPIGAGEMAEAPVIGVATVQCISLDELCPNGADFVKIDIEGGEVMALQGCLDVDRWSRTYFIVECHDTFDQVAHELSRLGKAVERIPHPLQGAHPSHCWAATR